MRGLREQHGVAAHRVDDAGGDRRAPRERRRGGRHGQERPDSDAASGDALARSVNSGVQIESGHKLTR